ncbi:hypothetical protein [Xanthobacter variabilis]|uniref:hypothetical protein n=2 Tax=Xanthobacter variabilis TaxID=3119932 RepID=UPI003726E174
MVNDALASLPFGHSIMLSAAPMPAGVPLHRLVVAAEPNPNALLRLLEPFVIHDVLPLHLDSRAEGEDLRLAITFRAAPDLAERLKMRLAVMPITRSAVLELRDEEPGEGMDVSAAA